MTGLVMLLALQQFPTEVFENTAAFQQIEAKDGWVMSKRAVKDSPYSEYRMVMSTTDSVPDLCEAIYEWGTHKNDGPAVTLNKMIVDGENLRTMYTQISQPVVANRDYALTSKREKLSDTVCRIRFFVTNDKAPARPEGFVRLDHVWGEWRFEAVPEGGSKVTYTLYSDPGGSVPAFLVHGSQQKSTRDAGLMGLQKTKTYVAGGRK